jgi:DNA-directed RNA polymerase subunit alpha
LKIAELSADDSVIDLTVLLRTGVGYVSNEENHELLSGTVDTIALDSIYSPVRTANFTVEPVRIKQKADSERLIVEITHFPTTKARDALEEALHIVERHARQLLACLTTQGSVDTASETTTSNENVMSKSLESVEGVKSRWVEVLRKAGVESVTDYLAHREESVSGFGEAGRKSVDEALRDAGISVPED